MIDKTYPLSKQPSTFLLRWRSMSFTRLIQYIFMYSSVPMLAYGVKIYDLTIMKTIGLTILALYSGFFATLIWNDITDMDIDAVAHPNRPLPAGRINIRRYFGIALIFSALTFTFSFLVSFWCLALVGAAALFVAVHNKYLKKMVKLPAYSEIFSPIQWIIVPLFGYVAITGSNYLNMILLAVFTYFADGAHDLPEGIHDAEGDRRLGVKTYATSFGEKVAAKVSFTMFFISGILGIILFFRTILTLIFLIPFLLLWFYALYHSYKLVAAPEGEMKELGKIVGQKTFRYFWLTYDLIFLDVLIQIMIFNF